MVPIVLIRAKAMDAKEDAPTRTSQITSPSLSMEVEVSLPFLGGSRRHNRYSRSVRARKKERSSLQPVHSLTELSLGGMATSNH